VFYGTAEAVLCKDLEVATRGLQVAASPVVWLDFPLNLTGLKPVLLGARVQLYERAGLAFVALGDGVGAHVGERLDGERRIESAHGWKR